MVVPPYRSGHATLVEIDDEQRSGWFLSYSVRLIPVDNGPARQMYYSHYLEPAMRRVTARAANQRFSEVLSAVETGEQVVITDRMIAAMNDRVTLRGGFSNLARNEMHECW